MKKVLFASTALVAFAGAASAEVTISGNAEAGLFGQDGETFVINNPGTTGQTIDRTEDSIDAQFFTDVDVTFTMSGETDNGLAFGAAVDLDEGSGDATGNDQEDGGIAVFLTGAFGTLTIGDTDGALDWALTEVAFNSGSINDAETDHAGWNGNAGLDGFGFGTFTGGIDPNNGNAFDLEGPSGDGQILRYDYSIADFAFAVSAEQVSAGRFTDDGTIVTVGDPDLNQIDGTILGVGVKFDSTFAGFDLGIGLGYQRLDADGGDADFDADAIGASINSGFGDFNFGVSYLTVDVDGDTGNIQFASDEADGYDHYGVGVGYGAGPIQASINYGRYDYDDGTEADGFGVSAGYDLGGGAVIQAGYGDSDLRATDTIDGGDRQSYSLGVRLNF